MFLNFFIIFSIWMNSCKKPLVLHLQNRNYIGSWVFASVRVSPYFTSLASLIQVTNITRWNTCFGTWFSFKVPISSAKYSLPVYVNLLPFDLSVLHENPFQEVDCSVSQIKACNVIVTLVVEFFDNSCQNIFNTKTYVEAWIYLRKFTS
jgi:hypothetical protein